MATPDHYIEAKKNAMKVKTDRKLWLESKRHTYGVEIEDIDYVLNRDQKVIEKLEKIKERYDDTEREISLGEENLKGLTGDEFQFALRSYMDSKTRLEEIEAEMRAIYYAK